MQTVTLAAEDLWSKWGFGDGNPFRREDLGPDLDDVEDPLLDEIHDLGMEHRCDLVDLLVRTHLVPAITAATGETPDLNLVYTNHNPTRDVRYTQGADAPPEWMDISVEVPEDGIRTALETMIGRRS